MARPTVNDIAREAGVSLATVDRVLNDRPGVKAKTVSAVQEAVARLGYVRDMAAANLARQRHYQMVAVLPQGAGQFVETLETALREAAQAAATARTDLRILHYPAEDSHALAARLAQLAEQDVAGAAVMAPETPVLRDAVKAMKSKGIPVIALVSDLPSTDRDHFVGIDSHAAGRTAGLLMGRFVGPGPGQIIAIAPSMQLRDAIERRRGFDEVMLADFPQLEVLPTLETHGSGVQLRQALTERLRHASQVRGIYLLGSGHRALAAALADLGLTGRFAVIGHELTPHTRRALLAGHIDAVVTQNLGHLARSTLRILRAKADRTPIDAAQELLRIEIVIRENLSPEQ
ncbi:MAG: LacI family DNA-binding transcriptional regulator [Paracoccaceae bacterium]